MACLRFFIKVSNKKGVNNDLVEGENQTIQVYRQLIESSGKLDEIYNYLKQILYLL